MLGHLRTILESLAIRGDQSLSAVSLLTPVEEQQLLIDWNKTAVDFPRDCCAHHLFEQQVERRPNALAISDGNRQLTYQELNLKANHLADRLRSLGVAPEARVGMLMHRSLELVIAEVAILKAGGAFVPLDPEYPIERLGFMLQDASITVLITLKKFADLVPQDSTRRVVFVDEDPNPAMQALSECSNSRAAIAPSNLAYVIYTSGSTGTPKGVAIEHTGLVNLMCWHKRAHAVSAADRATLIASPGFDASVWEIWANLGAGASVHIPPPECRLSPVALLDWLASQQITTCFLPTPLAEALVEQPIPKQISLRMLLTGGDRLHRAPMASLPFAVSNHYGPTENTVVSTFTVVKAGELSDPPPIGRPISNTTAYILDGNLRPVPIGVPGELHVSGVGVARGYLNRPELDAAMFIPNPFAPSSRLYKTGDRARYRSDGQIEFLGRIDDQVKVRGFRIEPSEIEAVIRSHPAVANAVVVVKTANNAEKQLVAYIVPNKNVSISSAELSSFVGAKVPAYMVPVAWSCIPEVPLTAHGKVDRKSLPEPNLESIRREGSVGTKDLNRAKACQYLL